MKGWRTRMEDAFVAVSNLGVGSDVASDRALFAIFDGHGGEEVALFCQRHFPEQVKNLLQKRVSSAALFTQAFDAMDDLLRLPESAEELRCLSRGSHLLDKDQLECNSPVKDYCNGHGCENQGQGGQHPADKVGSTALAILLTAESVVCGNAGSSGAVLCRGGNAVELSFNHKPSLREERRRIEEAGAILVQPSRMDCHRPREPRINGSLSISRSIGDFAYKGQAGCARDRQAVICTPDVQSIALGPEDEFLVLASDGVWEMKSSSDVCDFIRSRLPFSKLEKIVEDLLDDCLAHTPRSRRGCDNMTCIVVLLPGHAALQPEGRGMKFASGAGRLVQYVQNLRNSLRCVSRPDSPNRPFLA